MISVDPAIPLGQSHALGTLSFRVDQQIGDDFLDGANKIPRRRGATHFSLTVDQIEQDLRIDATDADLQPVTLDHAFDLERGNSGDVEPAQRFEHENAIDAAEHFRREAGRSQRMICAASQFIGIVGTAPAQIRERIDGGVRRQDE